MTHSTGHVFLGLFPIEYIHRECSQPSIYNARIRFVAGTCRIWKPGISTQMLLGFHQVDSQQPYLYQISQQITFHLENT